MPGELSQEAGRAYVYVFGGCLERAVKGFKQTFDVYTSPDKLAFKGFSGAEYSFDLSGVYHDVEAFVECKGYRDGSGILEGYKEFLAKAYCTSVQAVRHQRDLFWFATNVPFGSSIGRRLCAPEFVREALTSSAPARAATIIGGAQIDQDHVRALSRRIAVAIFTDSFVKVMGTLYRFRPGDTLWSATKLIHGGHIPLPQFEPIVARVKYMNDLNNPDRIRSGQRLHLPWFGIRDDDQV
jgi:hypothetical protein